MVRYREWRCALRLRHGWRLLALGGVWPCRRLARARNGYEQPPFRLALARWLALVCNTEGIGCCRSCPFSREFVAAARVPGTFCRRRRGPAVTWSGLEGSGRT